MLRLILSAIWQWNSACPNGESPTTHTKQRGGSYDIFFAGQNGMWVQFLRMLWVGNGWAAANKVIRGSNEIYQEVSPITHARKMEVSTGMRPATRPRCDCFLIKDTFGIAKNVEVSQDEIFQNFRPLRTNAPPCFTLKRRELVIMESIFKWRAFLNGEHF
jgi:hypothetical protein